MPGVRRRKFDAISALTRRSKSGAKKRRIRWALTKAYLKALWKTQAGRCALSNEVLTLASTSRRHTSGETSASLDRIDSSLGYEVGNVQWVHKDINVMKWTLPQDEFIKWCRRVARASRKRRP